MTKADKEIKYRPELSEKLKKSLEFALEFYSLNFKKIYYAILSKACEEKDAEKARILKEASDCFDDELFGEERFWEVYESELKTHRIEIVSTARAAYTIFKVYEDFFDENIRKEIDTTGLSKMELFMIEDFFNKLKSPMRNPNIEIKEGYTKCWYDRNPYVDYLKDLNTSMEYMRDNCNQTIEIFAIPDEKVFTGFYDVNGKEIYVGDKVKEGCNGLIGTVGWDTAKGTYKLIEYGEGYEIENSHIEWEVID